MKRIKRPDTFCNREVSEAIENYLKRCRLRNLSPRSVQFYEEVLKHFTTMLPRLRFVSEINQDTLDEYVLVLMNRNNKITSINTRLRGIYAFIRFCFKQEYLAACLTGTFMI